MTFTERPSSLFFQPIEPQRLIKQHLLTHELAMLFVGMGLGKTASCLDTLNTLFRDVASIGVLVVAPLRVANLTWPMEVEQWEQFQWMRVANLRTKEGQKAFRNGSAHIYTINYEGIETLIRLVADMTPGREAKAEDLPFDTVIYDESTKVKNHQAKRIQQFRIAIPRVQRRWAMTGTPAPNSLLDLFAQVRLVDDGKRLGHQFTKFKKEYFFSEDWDGRVWQPKPGAEQTVEQKISDITLTLLSKDWLPMTEVHFEDVDVHLTKDLKKQYDELEAELVLELDDVQITAANAGALINKLMQFTAGSMYYMQDIQGSIGVQERKVQFMHNHKMDALAQLVTELKHEPLLVGVNFQHEQDSIRRRFPQAVFVDDFKSQASQMDLVRRWNRKELPMMVAHPGSVGHGLNFQYGCNNMCWTSLTHNREHYEQMIGRLARQGQTKVVNCWRLMVPQSVDYAVATTLQSKQDTEHRLLNALKMLESFRKTHHTTK